MTKYTQKMEKQLHRRSSAITKLTPGQKSGGKSIIDLPPVSPYHAKMADKRKKTPVKNKTLQSHASTPKKPGKNMPTQKKKPWGVLFWIVFFLAISGLFLINRDTIRKTLEQSQSSEQVYELNDFSAPVSENSPDMDTGPDTSVHEPANTVSPPPLTADLEPATLPDGADSSSAELIAAEKTPESVLITTRENQTPAQTSVFRDRSMYFINVDRDGTILRTKVNRSLPVTDSPLTDTLSALLTGPVPEEQRRGLISLIPEGTRIMNATVRGNTAYINLNEDFQFNTYGVEGYAGALRQIVWTATEFSNIRDVQILIEGRRVDYLGEGVWIGSPVNREMY